MSFTTFSADAFWRMVFRLIVNPSRVMMSLKHSLIQSSHSVPGAPTPDTGVPSRRDPFRACQASRRLAQCHPALAIKRTRLSCRSFATNAVRLQLNALAYNLGNFLRKLAMPEPIKNWSGECGLCVVALQQRSIRPDRSLRFGWNDVMKDATARPVRDRPRGGGHDATASPRNGAGRSATDRPRSPARSCSDARPGGVLRREA